METKTKDRKRLKKTVKEPKTLGRWSRNHFYSKDQKRPKKTVNDPDSHMKTQQRPCKTAYDPLFLRIGHQS